MIVSDVIETIAWGASTIEGTLYAARDIVVDVGVEVGKTAGVIEEIS